MEGAFAGQLPFLADDVWNHIFLYDSPSTA